MELIFVTECQDSGLCSKRPISSSHYFVDILQVRSASTTRAEIIGTENPVCKCCPMLTQITNVLMHCCRNDNSHPGESEDDPKPGAEGSENGGNHCHAHLSQRLMFATITVAVCHCGAGCLLGDIVGEWLVYGTDAKINGRHLWVAYLVGVLYFFAALCASLTKVVAKIMGSLFFLGSFSSISQLLRCLGNMAPPPSGAL